MPERRGTFAFLRSLMLQTSADLALIESPSEMQSTVTRDWLLELLDLTPVVLLSPEPDPEFVLVGFDGPVTAAFCRRALHQSRSFKRSSPSQQA